MRLVFACLLAIIPVPALAEALTLSGTLGNRDILVELTQPKDGAVAGRYTFRDTGGDIPLVAVSHDDKSWVLNEEAPCGEADCVLDDNAQVLEAPVAATWQLTYDPQTFTATGTRSVAGGKAKTQPLTLNFVAWRPLGESEEAAAFSLHDRSAQLSYMRDWPLDWSGAPYEMALMDVPLTASGEQSIDGATYHMVTDPRTKFAFPRAVSFADGSPVEAANAILADHHARLNLAAFDCLAFRYASYGVDSEWGIRGGFLGDYDNEYVELSYLSPTLVSWTQSGSLWCTGAHPYNHFDSYTYDVAKGAQLSGADLMADWVPREWGAAPGEVADTDLAFENPDAYQWGPGPELIAFVRERISPDVLMDETDFDGMCYGDQAIADQLDVRFAAGPSLVFTVSGYPHVMSACMTDLFTIPLEEVRHLLKPEALAAYFPDPAD